MILIRVNKDGYIHTLSYFVIHFSFKPGYVLDFVDIQNYKNIAPQITSLPIAKVIESPELKALELFIAEKNSEILCRFDGLLQQQQLLSTKKKHSHFEADILMTWKRQRRNESKRSWYGWRWPRLVESLVRTLAPEKPGVRLLLWLQVVVSKVYVLLDATLLLFGDILW